MAIEERINTRDDSFDSSALVAYPSAFFDALAMAVHPWIDRPIVWERSVVATMLSQQYYNGTMAWLDQLHSQQQQQQPSEQVRESESSDDEDVGEADAKKEDEDLSVDPLPALDRNPWEIPLVCPTEQQQQQLLLFSLEVESRYLPKLFRKGSAEHRASFNSASKTSFCWVDVDTFLLSTEWHNFIVETCSTDPPPPTAAIATE